MASALFDVGGTHTRLAFADGDSLAGATRFDTRANDAPASWLREVLDSQADGREEIDPIIVALPGVISGTTLIEAHNLPQWSGADFAQIDAGVDVTLINDADAAALGEAHYGAGREYSRFGYVTISTGIGGGLVQDGQLAVNQLGFEVGKQIIDWQSQVSLESLAGGSSVIKSTGQMTGMITDAQQLQPIIDQLAAGLFNVALLWSTDQLVVNGPSLFESKFVWPLLQESFMELQASSGLQHTININRAHTADDAGLYGCLALANDKASQDQFADTSN